MPDRAAIIAYFGLFAAETRPAARNAPVLLEVLA